MDINKIEKQARDRNIPIILEESLVNLTRVVRENNPQRILEIGTAVGFSGIKMLQNANENTVLDTIEIDPDRANEAIANFKYYNFSKNVNVHVGDAVDILSKLKDNKYDLVFIDGPKSKYLQYLKMIENNLKIGSIVFADNVLFRGMVKNKENPSHKYRTIVLNLREYLNYIATDKFSTQLLEVGDGIAITKVIK